MEHQRWTSFFLALFVAWTLSSCATRDSGYKISDETIAFIRPGVTTRAEVVENLGPPLLELQDARVVAYSWGKMRVSAAAKSSVGRESTQSPEMGYQLTPPNLDETGLVETRRWICCIALDEKDVVARVEKLKVDDAPSLERAVRQWAGAK